jgi:hypothetical protein
VIVEEERAKVKPDPVLPAVRVPTLVSDDVVTPEANVVPVSVLAGAITTFPEAAVIRPLPFTVKLGIDVDEPNDPTLEFTVESVVASVPLVVMSPERSPLVIEDAPENFVIFPVAGDPVVVTVPPDPEAVSVVPENAKPDPNVISEGAAPKPVGFPSKVEADSF